MSVSLLLDKINTLLLPSDFKMEAYNAVSFYTLFDKIDDGNTSRAVAVSAEVGRAPFAKRQTMNICVLIETKAVPV